MYHNLGQRNEFQISHKKHAYHWDSLYSLLQYIVTTQQSQTCPMTNNTHIIKLLNNKKKTLSCSLCVET